MSNIFKKECFINGVQYYCRTCFDPARALYSLDESNNTKTWRQLLKEVAQLQASEDELLPQTVCGKCLDKLINHYDFILQIHNVNKRYSELMGSCRNEIISNEIDSFAECLADAAIADQMENITEIKVEDELLVPYDILLSSNNTNQDSEAKLKQKDLYDPFMETCTSVNEVTNQHSDNENYNNFISDCSSPSSKESEFLPENKLQKLEYNHNNISRC